MQRLAELEHRVVRRVDDGVDRTHARRRRAAPAPAAARRGASTPRRSRARYRGHAVGRLDPHRRDRRGRLVGLRRPTTSGSRSGTPVAAATSRATPRTDRKSGRFGSTSMSSTGWSSSERGLRGRSRAPGRRRSGAGCPRGRRRSRAPAASTACPSDTTPRISRRPSGSSRTGTRAPGGAHGTRSPGRHVAHADDELGLAGPVLDPREAELVGASDGRGPRAPATTTTPSRPAHGYRTASTFTPRCVISSASSSTAPGRSARTPGASRAGPSRRRPELREEPDVAIDEHPHVRDRVAQERDALDAQRRTRTPCTARRRTRSSPGPSDGPCRRRAARSSRCRTRGSRPRRRGSSSRRPRRRARRTGSTRARAGSGAAPRTAPSPSPRACP